MSLCPNCASPQQKALFYGMPVRLCSDTEDCCMIEGFWSFLIEIFPFNGVFFVYEDCSWIKAFWAWATGNYEVE